MSNQDIAGSCRGNKNIFDIFIKRNATDLVVSVMAEDKNQSQICFFLLSGDNIVLSEGLNAVTGETPFSVILGPRIKSSKSSQRAHQT